LLGVLDKYGAIPEACGRGSLRLPLGEACPHRPRVRHRKNRRRL